MIWRIYQWVCFFKFSSRNLKILVGVVPSSYVSLDCETYVIPSLWMSKKTKFIDWKIWFNVIYWNIFWKRSRVSNPQFYMIYMYLPISLIHCCVQVRLLKSQRSLSKNLKPRLQWGLWSRLIIRQNPTAVVLRMTKMLRKISIILVSY